MTIDPTDGFRPGGKQTIPRPPHWAPGPGPSWPAGLEATSSDVRAVVPPPGLPLEPAFDGARISAVLVALADGADGAEVLLTRRSMDLRTHRGEVSFPGGRVDPGETPTDAALREAHEEVGLDPTIVDVYGELPHLNTVVSRSYIVPLVATLPSVVPLTPASPEVDRVLWVPLTELVRADTYHTERWGSPPMDRLLHFFHLDDETIWGATAHLLAELLRLVAGRVAPSEM